jgi:hypothetical protein
MNTQVVSAQVVSAQVVSVSVPQEFLSLMTISSASSCAALLSLYFELGVKWVDQKLWDHNSSDVFAKVAKDAQAYKCPKVPTSFSVTRRSYLKCMFTAKEHNLTFYDLSCWCTVHGFFLVRENLRSGLSFDDMYPNWVYGK